MSKKKFLFLIFLLEIVQSPLNFNSKKNVPFLHNRLLTSTLSQSFTIDKGGKTKAKINFYGTDIKIEKTTYQDGDGATAKKVQGISGGGTSSIASTKGKMILDLEIVKEKDVYFYTCCSSEDYAEFAISTDNDAPDDCRLISQFKLGDLASGSAIKSIAEQIGSNGLTSDLGGIKNAGIKTVQYSLENEVSASIVELSHTKGSTENKKISMRYAKRVSGENLSAKISGKFYNTDISASDVESIGNALTNCNDDLSELEDAYKTPSVSAVCEVDEGEGWEDSASSFGKKCDEVDFYSHMMTRSKPIEDDNNGGLTAGEIAGIAVGSAIVVGGSAFSFVWFKVLKKPPCCKKHLTDIAAKTDDGGADSGKVLGAEENDGNNKPRKHNIKNAKVSAPDSADVPSAANA